MPNNSLGNIRLPYPVIFCSSGVLSRLFSDGIMAAVFLLIMLNKRCNEHNFIDPDETSCP